MAHKGQKLQFEVVAVLGLISLFTHSHIFWIAGLLLALVDLPDFSTPLTRIAGSVEKIADSEGGDAVGLTWDEATAAQHTPASDQVDQARAKQTSSPPKEVGSHV